MKGAMSMPNINPKLYLGTQNGILYIIDKPPRPYVDDMADIPGVSIIAKLMESTSEAQRIGQIMVDAYNQATKN
jgi:hypothetical protein